MAERKFHTENSGHRTLWKHRHEYELCQSKKSLSLISPEVRMTRSGAGESPVYRHLSSSSSETSLEQEWGYGISGMEPD
jgi:hypothetical protein